MGLENKKIVFMATQLGNGGLERVCVRLANQIAIMGYNVEVVTLKRVQSGAELLLSDQIKHVVLCCKGAASSAVPLMRYIKHKSPDLIVTFNYQLPVVITLLRFLFRFEFKIISRNMNTISKELLSNPNLWNRVILNPTMELFLPFVDGTIHQCNEMRDDYKSFFGTRFIEDKNVTIYNPIPERSVIKLCTEEHQCQDRYFLCVGRLSEQKNFSDAIKAFGLYVTENPTSQLFIAGEGPKKNELLALVNQLNLNDRVHFLGYVKEMKNLFSNATATILTSHYEGFPNVLIESLMYGTPVISYNCPSGPSEIINDGVNGFIVPQYDIISLVAKMKEIKNIDNSLCIESVKRFDINNIACQYLKFFEKIMIDNY